MRIGAYLWQIMNQWSPFVLTLVMLLAPIVMLYRWLKTPAEEEPKTYVMVDKKELR